MRVRARVCKRHCCNRRHTLCAGCHHELTACRGLVVRTHVCINDACSDGKERKRPTERRAMSSDGVTQHATHTHTQTHTHTHMGRRRDTERKGNKDAASDKRWNMQMQARMHLSRHNHLPWWWRASARRQTERALRWEGTWFSACLMCVAFSCGARYVLLRLFRRLVVASSCACDVFLWECPRTSPAPALNGSQRCACGWMRAWCMATPSTAQLPFRSVV